jgi:ATP-dependent 26S proteasome regulatory subunit
MSKMNNKKSDNYRNWFLKCNKCSYYSTEESKSNDHHHDCNKEKVIKETTQHQFILKDDNIASLQCIDQNDELIKTISINKDVLFDFVFINPITMKLCQFKIGQYVLLRHLINNNSNDYVIQPAIVWPSSNIPISSISLNKSYSSHNGFQFTSNSNVLVTNITLPVSTVNKITLSLNNPLSYYPTVDLNDSNEEHSEEIKLIEAFLKEIYCNKCIGRDQLMFLNYMNQKLSFQIVSIATNDHSINQITDKFNSALNLNEKMGGFSLFKITQATTIEIKTDHNKSKKKEKQLLSFENIGGLEKEMATLKEIFINPFQFESLYKEIGVNFSKGVLIYGSPGCGKTLIAKTLCSQSKCHLVEVKVSQLFSTSLNEVEVKLKQLFNEAWSSTVPCIIFIDEFETLCPQRETLTQQSEKRIVNLFSNLLDESKTRDNILLLCVTNKIDLIDKSLRRPGRFDIEIEIPIPNRPARYKILTKKLKTIENNLNDEQIVEIAQSCHGYVGADLEMLVQEAGYQCIKRLTNSNESPKALSIDDLHFALTKIKASAAREISFDIPKVFW